MTDIVNMQTRVPKPGLFKELLDEMAAKFKTIDRPGVLYFPVAHLLTQNPGITAAFPTTAEAADKTLDNSLESDPSNYWEYFKSIGEKCESMRHNNLIVIENTENNLESPKYLVRTLIKAKRAKGPQVVELLKSYRDKLENKPMIARPMAGSWDTVRVSAPAASLEEVTQGFASATSPENKSFVKELAELTIDMYRDVNRIYISNWPS
tara:strand:- start:2313 stop:2936 length:624 start_codon:yes stop_codon:yes gene_type:complete